MGKFHELNLEFEASVRRAAQQIESMDDPAGAPPLEATSENGMVALSVTHPLRVTARVHPSLTSNEVMRVHLEDHIARAVEGLLSPSGRGGAAASELTDDFEAQGARAMDAVQNDLRNQLTKIDDLFDAYKKRLQP